MPTNELNQVGVFYNGILCGDLIKNKAKYMFKYNQDYLDQDYPPISYNLELQTGKFESESLHPFFDNLVSEGWLRQHQVDALKIAKDDKFAILTHFGFDMAGAVYFDTPQLEQNYPMKIEFNLEEQKNLKRVISIESRASISGIQKKVLVREQPSGMFSITTNKEISTHIAKLNIEEYPEIIELEFISTLAVKHLLPEDLVCEIKIGHLNETNEKALFIKRFDRGSNDERFHFEEFNSLLNKKSDDKYLASYDDIGHFIRNCPLCRNPHQTCLTVYKRILAYFLVGNTDAHLKNFAMFHTDERSLLLTPMYDIVAASFYSKFSQLALKINNQDYEISGLKPKNLVNLGRSGFGLSDDDIMTAVKSLEANLQPTIDVLNNFENVEGNHEYISKTKTFIITSINKRWNGSFNGIAKFLQKNKSKE